MSSAWAKQSSEPSRAFPPSCTLRLAELGSLPDRLRVAMDWAVQSAVGGGTAKSALAYAWPHADTSPDLRERLPAWIDTGAIASAWVTLIDGFSIRAAEAGGISAEDARREAYALLELLLAAPETMPASVARVRQPSLRPV